MGRYDTLQVRGIYTDLLRELIKRGHYAYVLSPIEKSVRGEDAVVEEDGCTIIRVCTGKIQKTNVVVKGINTVLLESRFKQAIKKYLSNVKFDLILYPTPPITLCGVGSSR